MATTVLRIELTSDDAAVLREALSLYLTEFRREVAGTENPTFRHALQRKEQCLERIVEELARHGA